ncbi:MAG: hypothetical protein H6624_06280 [Bdellovibrionaceae bacterium]|nr:hypothetical protein [Bdellovibrionales bacterium]MCB9083931.1 hypothetical protein [Pseudobdellovibrionaceae bacterium]
MANKTKNGKTAEADQSSSGDEEFVADFSSPEGEGDPRSKGVSDAIKKVISAGIGAAFMTEESIRSYLAEVRLPKDVMNLLLQSASKSKEELLDRVGNEVVRIISKIDFVDEASRFVEEHKFRISAEVEVIKKEKAVEE